ncbi:hypothetical protein SAMN05421890_0363 [Ensifer adhaerens]|nr:hypothetical protein SAMN05421890_0363 [Ensifer adhaerens]
MGNEYNRQPAQSGGTIVIAIFIFAACAFISALAAAYHRDKFEKLAGFLNAMQKPAPAVSLPHPRSAKRGRVTRQLILTARLARPGVLFRDAAFSQADKFAETDFCALLQQAFPDLKLAWQANALFSDTSDCAGELNASQTPDDALHNSLFIETRRRFTGAATSVRLKLVTVPERQEETFDAPFERAAELVLAHLLSGEAPEILKDVRARKPFNLEIRGIAIRFFEEQLAPGSFNLMMEARCGKHRCQTTNPFYRLNMPALATPAAAVEPVENLMSQQE